MRGADESICISYKAEKPKDKQKNRACTFNGLLMDLIGLSEVYFLCKNKTMKEIFNPYLSNDDRDILFMLMEVDNATISDSTKLQSISTVFPTTLPGQVDTVAKSVSASG